jgi:predicted MFS family arabinose efflux permease
MNLRNYILVTSGYWSFTLTDGALRMLVLLHFNELGYSAVAIAFLFLAYELMGIFTNLLGGWVGSRRGLNQTLIGGLILQICALILLSFQSDNWVTWLSVSYVMGAQALSGIAKDLTKMSSKSAVKTVASNSAGALFKLVAILTGSKNALKGIGFFLGAGLLSWVGYETSLIAMAVGLTVVVIALLILLNEDIGKSKSKVSFSAIFSKSSAINRLSFARFFLFGSRDIWFVVALPVFLSTELGWSHQSVGGFLAAWVIGYGIVQSITPRLIRSLQPTTITNVQGAQYWALLLLITTVALAVSTAFEDSRSWAVMIGLAVFGAIFAVNSSLHSYLILAYSNEDSVALDVGFYYSSNAAGRLIGTFLSGIFYYLGGLTTALWGSAVFVFITLIASVFLPEETREQSQINT